MESTSRMDPRTASLLQGFSKNALRNGLMRNNPALTLRQRPNEQLANRVQQLKNNHKKAMLQQRLNYNKPVVPLPLQRPSGPKPSGPRPPGSRGPPPKTVVNQIHRELPPNRKVAARRSRKNRKTRRRRN
jgi:hypothetical protein